MKDLIQVPFHGDHITAIMVAGRPMIALKPVCERFGLDWSAQYRRLHRQPWASTSIMATQLPGDTQNREVTFVDRRTFTMWLATVETSRLKNEATKELLVAYQREAADALDQYFHEGAVINPRVAEHNISASIRHAQMRMELLQASKGLIHPDHLEAHATAVLARGLGEAPQLDTKREPLYTQDFLREKNLSAKETRRVSGVFGKRVKAAYTLEHGTEPHKYPMSMSNGQVRRVNAYTEADRHLMQQVWDQYYANRQVAA